MSAQNNVPQVAGRRKRMLNKDASEVSAKRSNTGSVTKLEPVFDVRNMGVVTRSTGVKQEFVEPLLSVLACIPARSMIALFNILEKDLELGNNNAAFNQLKDDLQDYVEDAIAKVGPLPAHLDGVYPFNMKYVAAHLGSKWLPDAQDCVSDEAFNETEESLTSIAVRERDTTFLRAVNSSKIFRSPNGCVLCYCGKTASFRQQTAFGNSNKKISYFECADDNCRFNITADALTMLFSVARDINVASVPEFYCKDHPNADIKMIVNVTNNKDDTVTETLRARCSSYNKGAKQQYCNASEIMAGPGQYLLTSTYLWKLLDVLYFLNQ